MKPVLLAASAMALLAISPASAQMMMSDGMGPRSCVSGGQFVPCPPSGGMMMQRGPMQPGMAMAEPGMSPPEMSLRDQRRMIRRQAM